MRAAIGALVLLFAAACGSVPDLARPGIDSTDPRFAGCAGSLDGSVVATFKLDHVGAWHEHIPAVEVPREVFENNGFAVVFRTSWPGMVMSGPQPNPDAGHADVCVWNGDADSALAYAAGKAESSFNVYGNLDMTGFRP